ncbi:tautomerase family protein [Rouxiella chamberiensis]|uniref:Tautomerase family protein n=1 Tax=Rouxiella chamberiensis TaxID=1513468 RepID=A0ABY7HT14_9GAMM|nr:tautomerase family protein [Rouxiella chamberiensis]WAT02554.1 tautomerase family protein [Rouxiella chamberiensis]
MPLLQFDLIQGRTAEEVQTLLDVAHEVVLQAFNVPPRDRYQIVHENPANFMVFQDTGLGFERSNKLVVVRVFTSPRSEEQKTLFMKLLAEQWAKHCDIDGRDLFISFITNSKGDWSFGFGEAQYLTGAL